MGQPVGEVEPRVSRAPSRTLPRLRRLILRGSPHAARASDSRQRPRVPYLVALPEVLQHDGARPDHPVHRQAREQDGEGAGVHKTLPGVVQTGSLLAPDAVRDTVWARLQRVGAEAPRLPRPAQPDSVRHVPSDFSVRRCVYAHVHTDHIREPDLPHDEGQLYRDREHAGGRIWVLPAAGGSRSVRGEAKGLGRG